MSQNAGACGAYGILLSTMESPKVVEICGRLREAVANFNPEEDVDEEDMLAVRELGIELAAELEAGGVTIPDGAALLWTGREDDRPARCVTPAEDWVFGFGLFSYGSPNAYPHMDKSFEELAKWHTWVWIG